ncbi:MAG: amino acid adenylation domain-containing protein, partial [bacterium]|nr:amino acid adenylation domain-containing protein [bacterium]
GAAYLPIEPEYPEDRINYMLKDSSAGLVLVDDKTGTRISKFETKPNGPVVLNLEKLEFEYASGFGNRASDSPPNASGLAYIIYTSGSTGNPKGVMIEHPSVVNRLNWMQNSYPIGAADVILQKTTIVFDVSVWELFWWSIVGARLVLLGPGDEKNPTEILRAIEMQMVTTMHFVPSMLSAFLEYIEAHQLAVHPALPSLNRVFASGEALLPQQAERFDKLLYETNSTKLINLYGPTEATVDVSYYSCPMTGKIEKIPIGKPIDNIQLYIINKSFRLQPVGVTGELCIAGDGLARGYLNKPELTAERFTKTGWQYAVGNKKEKTPITNNYLYRTGDLACWLQDGNIEFLGRIDHQVKIRGFRIELGEIESSLLKHPEIKETAVLIRNKKDDHLLYAYYVENKNIDPASGIRHPAPDLRDFLSQTLPDYMLPSFFIKLEKIPLTTNGKIDRKALLQHSISNIKSQTYTAPRNDIEKKMVEIWREILEIREKKISIDEDFFHIGGHSLKATVMAARIHKEFNAQIPLTEIFKNPTIRQLAAKLNEAREEHYHSIEPVEKKEYYPLSYNQKRLYFIHRVNPGNTSYNMPAEFVITHEAQEPAIRETLNAIARKHESIRTYYRTVNGEPQQFIKEKIEIPLKINDLSTLPQEEKQKQRNALIQKERTKPFNLSEPPLFRVQIIKIQNGQWEFNYNMHHIITDGWSMEQLKRDFSKYYDA